MKTGRPVRLETDIEYVTIQGGLAPLQLHLKIGVKKDGSITAIDATAKDNAGSTSYTYDANGNMTGKGGQGLTFGVENRPNASEVAHNR